MLDHLMFFSCLEFAILNSLYSETVLKPKQVLCIESLYLKKDVMCVLPTGYGKSLIFHLLPMLFYAKYKLRGDLLTKWKANSVSPTVVDSIVIVVSPLTSLIRNQICRLQTSGIRASIVSIRQSTKSKEQDEHDESTEINFENCEEKKLYDGYYHIVFAHPEALISSIHGRQLMLSETYQENVVALVVDEAHCIIEWGDDFRKDYGKLGTLCAIFPDIPCLALTATASHADMQAIKDSLGLKKNCKSVIANPDRRNIFYKKVFRHGQDVDAIQSILTPIAMGLLNKTNQYPLTIVYLPLRLCGFVYRMFEHLLGARQYFPPGSAHIPANRLFAQYHSPQTDEMKQEILKQISSKDSTIRVVFATVAIGMGVDIPCIRQVIHIGPPRTVKAYLQETGRAGRDGKSSSAYLYYNNRDIGTNRPGMKDGMRNFCQNEEECLRRLLLKSLDFNQMVQIKPLHRCCSICEKQCNCPTCQRSSDEMVTV